MSRVRFNVTAGNFAEAITAAGELLVEAGHVRADYVPAMVRVVEELGPYIVLVDGIALAHAAPGDSVLENSIALVSLSNEVDFGSGKLVKLVFALAAKDHDAHIETLGRLAELLADDDTRKLLLNADEYEQIRPLLSTVLGE